MCLNVNRIPCQVFDVKFDQILSFVDTYYKESNNIGDQNPFTQAATNNQEGEMTKEPRNCTDKMLSSADNCS
jgi:hypothetical protein